MGMTLLQSATVDSLLVPGLVLASLYVFFKLAFSGSSNQEPDYRGYVQDQITSVDGYRSLSDAEQEFLFEYGVDLSKRGYRLEPDIRRLRVTYSDQPVAAFSITESNSLDIVVQDETGEWVGVKPSDGGYEQSELKRKEKTLDDILPQ